MFEQKTQKGDRKETNKIQKIQVKAFIGLWLDIIVIQMNRNLTLAIINFIETNISLETFFYSTSSILVLQVDSTIR